MEINIVFIAGVVLLLVGIGFLFMNNSKPKTPIATEEASTAASESEKKEGEDPEKAAKRKAMQE